MDGAERQDRICNMHSCPANAAFQSFRSQQCAQYDDVPYRVRGGGIQCVPKIAIKKKKLTLNIFIVSAGSPLLLGGRAGAGGGGCNGGGLVLVPVPVRGDPVRPDLPGGGPPVRGDHLRVQGGGRDQVQGGLLPRHVRRREVQGESGIQTREEKKNHTLPARRDFLTYERNKLTKNNVTFMFCSNDIFHYMLKAEYATLVSLKVPSGVLCPVLCKTWKNNFPMQRWRKTGGR